MAGRFICKLTGYASDMTITDTVTGRTENLVWEPCTEFTWDDEEQGCKEPTNDEEYEAWIQKDVNSRDTEEILEYCFTEENMNIWTFERLDHPTWTEQPTQETDHADE